MFLFQIHIILVYINIFNKPSLCINQYVYYQLSLTTSVYCVNVPVVPPRPKYPYNEYPYIEFMEDRLILLKFGQERTISGHAGKIEPLLKCKWDARAACTRSKFFYFHGSFRKKIRPSWHPPSGKSWIHHWYAYL